MALGDEYYPCDPMDATLPLHAHVGLYRSSALNTGFDLTVDLMKDHLLDIGVDIWPGEMRQLESTEYDVGVYGTGQHGISFMVNPNAANIADVKTAIDAVIAAHPPIPL